MHLGTAFCLLLVLMGLWPAAAQTAQEIISGAGVEQGFCVHVGCGDGSLTADLHNGATVLVQGLTTDKAGLAGARATVAGKGVYGGVAIDWIPSYKSLPYNDNIANLVVADLGALGSDAPSQAEVMRIVQPFGVAYIRNGGNWTRTVKPMPSSMDEWSHYNKDASSNIISSDSLVGPVSGLQWYVSNEANQSSGMVLSGGRMMFSAQRVMPGRWKSESRCFQGRDAFNGVLLWQDTEGSYMDLARGQNQVTSFCADHNYVYGSILDTGYARKVDAVTGQEVLVYSNGLYLPNRDKVWERKLYSMTHVLFDGDLLQAFLKDVVSLDPGTGAKNWGYTAAANVAYLCAGEAKVFIALSTDETYEQHHYGGKCATITSVVALNASNGSVAWTSTVPAGYRIYNLIYHEGAVFMADVSADWGAYAHLLKLNAADGSVAMQRAFTSAKDRPASWPVSVWVTDDAIMPSCGRYAKGYDISTGADLPEAYKDRYFGHCTYFRGTPHGQTGGFFGYIDYRTKKWYDTYVTRNNCDHGLFPAYGMLFNTSAGCNCYQYLHGYVAMRCSTLTPCTPVPDDSRLETGVAAPAPSVGAWPATGEWPIMLGDPARTGWGTTPVDHDLKKLFSVKIPVAYPDGIANADSKNNHDVFGDLTPPTIADRKVFVAATNLHKIYALDAGDGSVVWSYQAGGRIDSPPTIYDGLCLFGCSDGYVYALRASDGALVWRFLAATARRNMIVSGQVESVWPLHGSVMVSEGKLFVSAGRHNQTDGGITLYKLNPRTGEVEAREVVDHKGWSHDDTPMGSDGYFGGNNSSRLNDLLVTAAFGNLVYMNCVAIEPQTLQWANMKGGVGGAQDLFPDNPSVDYTSSTPGVISYFHYQYSTLVSRYPQGAGGRFWPGSGWHYNTLGWNGDKAKGIRADRFIRMPGSLYAISHRGANVFRYALDQNGEPATMVPDTMVIKRFDWVYGYIGAGDRLCVLGVNGEWRQNKWIWAYDLNMQSADSIALSAEPVHNGLATAYGKLFVTLQDGTVEAYGGEPVAVSSLTRFAPVNTVASSPAVAPGAVVHAYHREGPVTVENVRRMQARSDVAAPLSPTVAGAAAPSPVVQEETRGMALQEVWAGVGGDELSDLTDCPYFPESPTMRQTVNGLRVSSMGQRNLGVRLRACLKPEQSGYYRFRLVTDAAAQILLSATADPGDAAAVASVESAPESGRALVESEGVPLATGGTYYVEVLYKADGPHGRCAVLWQGPDGQWKPVGGESVTAYIPR